MHRCNRCNTTGGGVLLYVHDSLQCVSCTPLNDLHINEAVWCTIQLRNNDKIVNVVYRSPNSSFDNSITSFLTFLSMLDILIAC